MKTVKEKLSILIPVHNEAKRIRHNLKETKETLDDIGYDYELIAIDDGSSDNSYQILEELYLTFRLFVGFYKMYFRPIQLTFQISHKESF